MAVDRTSEHYRQTTKIIWDWFAVADKATGKLLYERLDSAGLFQAPVTDAAIERLAWHMFTEFDDMDHKPTADQAHAMWINPRTADRRQFYVDQARQYLEIAAGVVKS